MRQNKTENKNFEEYTFPHLEDIYRTAMYLLDNESDAQDLVRESFIKAYESWHEGRFDPGCRIWLFRIMVNVLIKKHWLSPNPSSAINYTDEVDGYLMYSRWAKQQSIDSTGQVPFSTISKDDVKKAIRDLPDNIRLIIVLSLLEDFSYREIAEIANINLDTVKSRLNRGRKLMQKNLFDHPIRESNYAIPHGRR
ncbi:MAG: hypothetical protein CVT49_12965 [candidate division Zixibacteria bacterium HGW-Zixibacteria-1]|nr:MAG: hypothetical protein CVT49_12965 [candidate division Zixibacteria bacterium HGW-Zixibacteria-1]